MQVQYLVSTVAAIAARPAQSHANWLVILNSGLRKSILPKNWLSSITFPIYRKSSGYDPLNYRPVSLASISCKVLKHIMLIRLCVYLEEISCWTLTNMVFVLYTQLLTNIFIFIDQGKTKDLFFSTKLLTQFATLSCFQSYIVSNVKNGFEIFRDA